MYNNLYDIVVALVGELPLEFHFVYAILIIVFGIFIILIPLSPFLVLWKLSK